MTEHKSQEIEQRRPSIIAKADELTVNEIVEQAERIRDAMARAMTKGEHYGVIPGTQKPTLFKPGAEKLCLMFRLDPEYDFVETWHHDGHYSVTAKCSLFHIPSGNRVAGGAGSCTTRESKYAWRHEGRVCPSCGKDAIVKQKKEKGGNFICVGNDKGGCWTKFDKNDRAILDQQVGRKPNPDLADSYNTVLKMACKRALVAAVLNGTAASDSFTQDLEDQVGPESQTGEGSGGSRDASDAAPSADTQQSHATAAAPTERQEERAETSESEPVSSSAKKGHEDPQVIARVAHLIQKKGISAVLKAAQVIDDDATSKAKVNAFSIDQVAQLEYDLGLIPA